MKRILLYIALAVALFSCGNSPQSAPAAVQKDWLEEQLSHMTLREKVGQLFCVRPEAFDAALAWDTYEQVASYQLREVTSRMRRVNERYPVGGIILFAHNIDTPEQLETFADDLKSFRGSPLLYIDEEGGRVARIGNNEHFDVKKYASMGAIGKTGKPANAYECGLTIGTYLKEYGLDVDLAPVADVNTNPDNPVIGTRAFSSDPEVAAKMVVQYLKGLDKAGIIGCVKHFPGHGDTRNDTHFGYAQTTKTWEELLNCEMVTFKAAIANGVPMVMSAHIGTPAITGNSIPATLSPEILTEKLRKELGFQGVIITDGMAMGAITRQYSPAEATLMSLQAGADIVLGPKDFFQAFDAVIQAVKDSTLTEERIDESVRRILALKARIRPEMTKVEDRVVLGDERFEEYLPLLQGRRVAIFSNQTGLVGGRQEHLLDALLDKGVNVSAIFSPEHGFRDLVDDGHMIADGVEPLTGVPILSLYGGAGGVHPTPESMDMFDVLVADIQDVGLRFYTYYITLCHLMDACGSAGKPIVLLDRPNPNGHYVDGPVLDMSLKSGVGHLPIPAVHGLTLGELALMAQGQHWLGAGNECSLTVIPCLNYTHHTLYELPVRPSPNLPNMQSVYLYPSLCPFEGTVISLGRGTDKPFQQYGHPSFKGHYDYSFTPQSMKGATHPPLLGQECYGVDLSGLSREDIFARGMDLSYVVDAYSILKEQGQEMGFFRRFFDLLMGQTWVREMIESGASADAIRARWQADVESFKKLRKPYLLYEE